MELQLIRYYVYAYIDLQNPGYYSADTAMGLFEFNYKPVYIGKGAGSRSNSHINYGDNQRLIEVIKNGSYEVRILMEGLPSHIAYQLETELIYRIGRMDLNKGPLLNESAGVFLNETKHKYDIGPYHLEFNKMLHIIRIMNSSKTLRSSAEILGISERSLYRYCKDYKLKKVDGQWVQVTA